MAKYRVIFSNIFILLAGSSFATYHQLATNKANKTAIEPANNSHLFVSIAHIKPVINGTDIENKPIRYNFCFLKKSHLKLTKQVNIKTTARTWYKPILKELKLNIGIAKDGYLDRGAKTIKLANSQNRTCFMLTLLFFTNYKFTLIGQKAHRMA